MFSNSEIRFNLTLTIFEKQHQRPNLDASVVLMRKGQTNIKIRIPKKQKHFLVSRVIQPLVPTDPVELVEIESVFSKATQVIARRDLQNDDVWRQGWV